MTLKWKEILKLKWEALLVPKLYIFQVIITSLGLLHSANLDVGLDEIERSIYVVAVIPIIFLMLSNGQSISRLLRFFSISCIAVAFFGFTSTLILDFNSFSEFIKHGDEKFLEYTGIQPLYLSIFLLLILFYFLESIRTNYNQLSSYSKSGLTAASLLVIAIVIFLRSKTALLLLPTLLVIYFLVVLKKRGWFVIFGLMMIGLLTILIDSKSPSGLLDEYGAVSKAFDQRLYIWRGAIEGINSSPWIGAGTGGTQELLNSGYAKIGYEEGITNNYNTHNQYLQFMARNGLIELLCFLAILGYSFWKSTKQSNYTFLMFNILVSLVMLTESFLSVQKGIVFFYFFLLVFIYLPEKKQEAPQI